MMNIARLVNSGNLLSQLLGVLPCVLPLSASTIRAKGDKQIARSGSGRQMIRDAIKSVHGD